RRQHLHSPRSARRRVTRGWRQRMLVQVAGTSSSRIRSTRSPRLPHFRLRLGGQRLIDFLSCRHSTGILHLAPAAAQTPVVQITPTLNSARSATVATTRSVPGAVRRVRDRKSTRLNSSHVSISYAV